ncbi:hypothetical protein [Chryseolinea lacunae]|uniref:Lipocalin-like domain-containing protein n=1 Tax=Chryseolinea lacunae TaxID=2801331 RepID=A0ABS1KQU2_9BACT|nr:hypothetical protein [Chryseolinea lacunae]MBL0741617.1 hypothetical protein [Chryseolinea lacunae]
MKKMTPSSPLTLASKFTSVDSLYPFLVGIVIFIVALILSSCSKDDAAAEDFSADASKLAGTYTVTDTDEYDEIETYEVTITTSKDGGAFVEISNFGDFMYVPVKATIKGKTFDIPHQTFKGKTMTIVLSGSGSLAGDVLSFKYILDTDDDYSFEHNCAATKKQGITN